MIVRSNEAETKQFKGVSFDVLATSEKSMITKTLCVRIVVVSEYYPQGYPWGENRGGGRGF